MDKENPGIDFNPERYYSDLLTIWVHQDEGYFTSVNVFLIMQGLLFVALYQIAIAGLPSMIAAGLAAIGMTISVMWLFVSARKGAAILLLEHQLRHLEDEIFAKRQERVSSLKEAHADSRDIDKAIEQIFPMYFRTARAVFLKNEKEKRKKKDNKKSKKAIPDLPFESEIEAHHQHELPDSATGFGSRSSMKIISRWVPTMFLLIWSFAVTVLALDAMT